MIWFVPWSLWKIRELNRKLGASGLRVTDFKRGVGVGKNCMRNREAQPCALTGFFSSEKWVKDLVSNGWVNAGPVILYLQFNTVIGFRAVDVDATTLLDGLAGINQYVHQNLIEFGVIHFHLKVGLDVH